jgi:hypothetical protein
MKKKLCTMCHGPLEYDREREDLCWNFIKQSKKISKNPFPVLSKIIGIKITEVQIK